MLRLAELSEELLILIAGHLTLDDLLPFLQSCKRFAVLARRDALWRELLVNHFGVMYKLPEETWRSMYVRKSDDPKNNRICPHVGWITDQALKPYVTKYQQVLQWLPKNLNCRTCDDNQAEAGLCLYIWKGNVRPRCRDCAYRFHATTPESYGILLRLNVLQMYCFVCSRLLGEKRGDPSEAYHVHSLLTKLTSGCPLAEEALEKKQQCLKERVMHSEESDRAYILESTYYLVDRMWLCSWFLRLCDGKLGIGPITNDALSDGHRLNPLARPRGAFSGGFSIVTPNLWQYLVHMYGLSGKAFTSKDIQGPEYEELRNAICKWRLI